VNNSIIHMLAGKTLRDHYERLNTFFTRHLAIGISIITFLVRLAITLHYVNI